MASQPLPVHIAFDLVRCGFIPHDSDEIVDKPTFKSSPPTITEPVPGAVIETKVDTEPPPTPQPLDARAIALVQQRMGEVVDQSAGSRILAESNKMHLKWKRLNLLFILMVVPVELFLLLYSTSKESVLLWTVSLLMIPMMVYLQWKLESLLLCSVHSFLSFTIHSVIALRSYIHNEWSDQNRDYAQNLKYGLSFDSKSGLYQMIGALNGLRPHESESNGLNPNPNQPIKMSIFYRFNKQFMAPILCETFDFEHDAISNLNAFHFWSRFVSEFLGVLGTFHSINGLQDQNYSKETVERIQTVDRERVRKVRESTLNGIRKVFYVLGLSVVVGVPLIINGSSHRMHLVPTIVITEGIVFLVFAVFSGSLCCKLYAEIWQRVSGRRARRHSDDGGIGVDQHRTHLVVDQGDGGGDVKGSKEWMNAIISEVDDFCVDLNERYKDQWTFNNEQGSFEGPDGMQYAGRVVIESVH